MMSASPWPTSTKTIVVAGLAAEFLAGSGLGFEDDLGFGVAFLGCFVALGVGVAVAVPGALAAKPPLPPEPPPGSALHAAVANDARSVRTTTRAGATPRPRPLSRGRRHALRAIVHIRSLSL